MSATATVREVGRAGFGDSLTWCLSDDARFGIFGLPLRTRDKKLGCRGEMENGFGEMLWRDGEEEERKEEEKKKE